MVDHLQKDFSLYIHIPFCTQKCDYCHFYVLPNQEHLHDLLLEGLLLEWQRVVKLLQNRRLVSIYFGGGTPSLFGAKRLQKLLNTILTSPILLSPFLEITLEANPEKIDLKLMQAYAEIGINRLSIGVQSFDDQLLKILGRVHSAKMAKEAIFTAVKAGIDNITIDLMYELPHQTVQQWQQTLNEVQELPITHLSLYNLTIEPQTLFYKKRHSLALVRPNQEESLEMYLSAVNTFKAQGLKQYEISAFAKEGFASQHNSGYWTARPFLGLGPSAFSFWNQQRFQNIANLNKYYKLLASGQSPVDFKEALSSNALRRELLVIHLRLTKGVDLTHFQHTHGNLDKETLDALEKLKSQRLLITTEKNVIKLSDLGLLYHDAIAEELI